MNEGEKRVIEDGGGGGEDDGDYYRHYPLVSSSSCIEDGNSEYMPRFLKEVRYHRQRGERKDNDEHTSGRNMTKFIPLPPLII